MTSEQVCIRSEAMAGRLKRRSSIGLGRDRRDSIGTSTTTATGTPIGKDHADG